MRTKHYALYMCLLLGVVTAGSCRSDDPAGPTAQEEAFEKLSGTWSLGSTGSITIDGQDASQNYPGFGLSFTNGTYATTNAGDLFRASGTWQWADGATTNLINVDDGKQVSIQALTQNTFTFSFSHSSGGASAGSSGNYTITVVK